MNLADVLVLVFFITALLRGVELGLVRQVGSTLGLVGGLFIGAFIQGKVIHLVHTPGSKALLALVVILGAVMIFAAIGEFAGAALKLRLLKTKLKGLDKADRTIGSVVAGATMLLVVWLAASIFASAPSAWLQGQLKNSVIIAELNKSLPPAPNVVARLGHLIDPNSFPEVFTGLEPKVDTDQPLPSIGELDPAVAKVRASVVKVQGKGCGGISQGTGFVADRNLIITNAHVVAGVVEPFVIDSNGTHQVEVIGFDPDLDIAVLRTSGLAGAPLELESGVQANGTDSATVGYPGGRGLTADPALVVESFKALGRNIYNQGETTREVYSIKGNVQPGSSGGPLVDKDGDVIGVIFAQSTSYDGVGYALVSDQVTQELNLAKDRSTVVGTGGCTQ